MGFKRGSKLYSSLQNIYKVTSLEGFYTVWSNQTKAYLKLSKEKLKTFMVKNRRR